MSDKLHRAMARNDRRLARNAVIADARSVAEESAREACRNARRAVEASSAASDVAKAKV